MTRRRRWLLLTGVLLVVVGVALFGRIGWFYYQSHTLGQQLLKQAEHMLAAPDPSGKAVVDGEARSDAAHHLANRPADSAPVANAAPVPSQKATVNAKPRDELQLLGQIEIPRLSLRAPLVEGTADPQIAVAVGHLIGSVQPGEVGTSLLAAHNATHFRHLDQLQPGDQVRVTTRQGSHIFTVKGSRVVQLSEAVENSPEPHLVLESCYPLDALYTTNQRYLVTCTLLQTES